MIAAIPVAAVKPMVLARTTNSVMVVVALLWVSFMTLTSASILYKSDPDFLVDLSTLELGKHISGGAGGVDVLIGPGDVSYTLKINHDRFHFEEEIFADKLYSVLGVSVPRFMVISNYSSLPSRIRDILLPVPFARIAEFVKADRISSTALEAEEATVKHFQDHFVVDAFMANRDANKDGNNIHSGDKFYRIDNGGSLRNRSVGKRKGSKKSDHWDAYLLPELRSMVKYRPDLYGTVPDEVVVAQAQAILAKSGQLLEAARELTTALSTDEESTEELLTMLAHRLRLLQMLVHAGSAFPADLARPVTALTGGGAFVMCEVDNVLSVLLGERRKSEADKDRKWVTLGGKSDFPSDGTLLRTVQREVYEETLGVVDLQQETLVEAPFYDFIHSDYFFRQYFVRLDAGHCSDADAILSTKLPHSLKHNRHTGVVEYHRLKWFPLELLHQVSPLGAMGDTGFTAYHAFASLLQVPHVKWLLQELRANRSIPEHRRHMQGMPARETGIPIYADFS